MRHRYSLDPKSHFALALCSCLFCCLLLGMVALFKSRQVCDAVKTLSHRPHLYNIAERAKLGTVNIIYTGNEWVKGFLALQVHRYTECGDIRSAHQASRQSRHWSTAAICLGLLVWLSVAVAVVFVLHRYSIM